MSRDSLALVLTVATLLCAPVAGRAQALPEGAQLQLDGWALSEGELSSRVGGQGKQGGDAQDRRLSLTVEGRRYEITLSPARSVLGGLPVAQRRAFAPTRLYRGTLAGMPDGWARVTVADDKLFVLIWDGHDFIAVEPLATTGTAGASKADRGRPAHRAYRPLAYEDLSFAEDSRAVPHEAHAHTLTAKAEAPSAAFSKANVGARMQVAWVADSYFRSRHGNDSQDEMLARINTVAGIFAEQLGLELVIDELTVLSPAEDDFSANDAGRLLDQVEQFKLATSTRRAAGVLHLMTGRTLDGNTVGIAAVGAACSARFGVSLTEARRPAAVDALIAAHEIGHNFDAPHDGEGACASTPGGYLMAPRLGQSDEFSPCSVDVMVEYLRRASCVSEVRASDVAVSGDPPAEVFVGTTHTVEYLIDSPGVGDAFDIGLTLNFADVGLDVRSVTLEGGICTRGDQRIDCTLAALEGGDAAVFRVTFVAVGIGSWPLSVAVSAPSDSDPTDNLREALVTVRPATDLAVSFDDAALVVTPGAGRRLPFSVLNAGPMVARDVVVEFSAEQSTLLDVVAVEGCRAGADAQQWRCEIPSLAVGEQRRGELVAVASADAGDGAVRREALRAEVWSVFPDPAPADNVASSELVVAASVADLAARLKDAAVELEIGEARTVELEITNHGPDPANSVLLDVAFSLGTVSVLEATLAGGAPCAIEAGAVRCQLDALAVGERSTVRLVLQMLAGERLRLLTAVASAAYDPAEGNDLVTSDLVVAEKSVAATGDAVGATAPAPANLGSGSSGGGGGGSFDPGVLVLLSLAVGLRRRRRSPGPVAA
ncbi:MAG: M12 family metallo-peptidase [Pseudomonadota bacterium]